MVIECNLVLAGKPLPYRSLLFDNDPPFARVRIRSVAVGIATYPKIIRLSVNLGREFPTPVFLIRFASRNAFFTQLFAKPCGQILAEATRVDKMRTHFREIESAGPEKKVKSIHGAEAYIPGSFIPAILRAKLGLPICLNIFFICAY